MCALLAGCAACGCILPDGAGLAMRTGVLVCLLLSMLGCSSGEASLADPCERSGESCRLQDCPCLVADPTEHCVRLDGCRDDRDCPAGTLCVSRAGGAPELAADLSVCAAPEGEAREGRCAIASQGFDRALVDGFRVNELPLEPVQETSAFTFSPPQDARFVACALFGCRPDVRAGRLDVEDNPVGEIVNYAQCSLSGAAAVFTVSEQSADSLSILAYTPGVDVEHGLCQGACSGRPPDRTLPPRGHHQVTELGVGCWAYDDTRLVGATLVVPVPDEQIPAIPNIDLVLSDCADAAKSTGRSCRQTDSAPELVDAPRFGACFEGKCRPRCVTAGDCPAALPSEACPQPQPTCAHSLDAADWSGLPGFVGVCLYRTCDRDDLLDAGAGGGAGTAGSP